MNFLNIGLLFTLPEPDTRVREWHLDEVIKALYFHNIDFYAIEVQRPELAEPTAVVSLIGAWSFWRAVTMVRQKILMISPAAVSMN